MLGSLHLSSALIFPSLPTCTYWFSLLQAAGEVGREDIVFSGNLSRFKSIYEASVCAGHWRGAELIEFKKETDNVLEAEKLPIADSREKDFYIFNMGKLLLSRLCGCLNKWGDAQAIPIVVENRQKFRLSDCKEAVLNFWEISIIEYFTTKYHFDFQVNTVTNKILQIEVPSGRNLMDRE